MWKRLLNPTNGRSCEKNWPQIHTDETDQTKDKSRASKLFIPLIRLIRVNLWPMFFHSFSRGWDLDFCARPCLMEVPVAAREKRNAFPRNPKIDKIVNDYLDKLHDARLKDHERVPGVAVAVRWNTKIVHLNCYGYANLETGAKITPDTVFDLGSLSKQFTAAAAYNLVIHNQLDIRRHNGRGFAPPHVRTSGIRRHL